MKYDPQKHHRRSIRLKGYDYTQSGAYFLTICNFQRDQIFGEITNGKMELSELGKIVREEWLRSAEIRKEIQVFEDEFMIMPNHLHGINWIVGADGVRLKMTQAHDMRLNPQKTAARSSSLRRAPR